MYAIERIVGYTDPFPKESHNNSKTQKKQTKKRQNRSFVPPVTLDLSNRRAENTLHHSERVFASPHPTCVGLILSQLTCVLVNCSPSFSQSQSGTHREDMHESHNFNRRSFSLSLHALFLLSFLTPPALVPLLSFLPPPHP